MSELLNTAAVLLGLGVTLLLGAAALGAWLAVAFVMFRYLTGWPA